MTITVMLDKLRVVKMEIIKQTLFEIFFLQGDHQGFLEEEKFRLTDKM